MQKVAEEWSTKTVRSTFRLFPGGIMQTSTTTSDLCGLGWRFTLNLKPDNSVSVHFDPHLVESSSFGQLHISTQLLPAKQSDHPTSINLPLSSYRNSSSLELTTIPAFSMLESPVLVISVKFLSDIILPTPPLGLPKMQEALYDTLSGREFLDTKFHLFSRRRSSTTLMNTATNQTVI
jgi:hypothetical protein